MGGAQQRGFTIVELLIVIVVIAILAAITIVSYTGIQTRATAAQYKTNAQTVVKKAEVFAQEKGVYPISTSSVTNDGSSASSLPSNLKIAFTTIGSGSMTNRICNTTTDPSGKGTYICGMYRNTNTGVITYIARECPYSTVTPTDSTGTGFRLFYVDPLNTDIMDGQYITVGTGCT